MDLLNKVLSRSREIMYDCIEEHKKNIQKRTLVYTSFDGDYMPHLFTMLRFVRNSNRIPINPESALGYYVSTVTHGGSKIPVMMDCIATELLCDELWIFNPVDKHMPEGVLAELMIWAKYRGSEVYVIDFFDGLQCVCDPETFTEKKEASRLSPEDIDRYIVSRTRQERSEIEEKLITREIPDTAYVIANFFNYKHIDWARAYCYKNGYCPVSPQNILPNGLYKSASTSGIQEQMLDRLALMDRSQRFIWFANTKNINDEIRRLDQYSLTELYYYLKYCEPKGLQIVDWAEAGVPKYACPEQWAITSVEKMKV